MKPASAATTMAPVYLNVYDLSPHNPLLQCLGLGGVYHSGVEAHGLEFAYGAHAHACSGIFATPPRECGGALGFRASIYVGETELTADEVQALVARMGASRFHGNRYHLLQHNCNAFAAELCGALTQGRGRSPPPWINRLAGLAVAMHCLLPASWVPPLIIMVVPPAADERQPLVGGSGGFYSSRAHGQQQQGQQQQQDQQHHRSALVSPPLGVVMQERVEEVKISLQGAGSAGAGAGAGGGGAGGAGLAAAVARAAPGARRPGTAWPAQSYDDGVP